MNNFISKMSKFEKIFWATISVLMLIFIIFSIIASSQTPNFIPKPKEPSPIITFKYIIQNNLDKHAKEIIEDKNLQLEKINDNINLKIDKLFIYVENNVDIFLDFHYSVIGEYIELGAMATGKISETIQKKLFGSDFELKIAKTSGIIDREYQKILREHLTKIETFGSDGVDIELNSDIFTTLRNDININEITQGSKIGLLVSSRFVPRLVQSISTKLAGKSIAKVIAKTSAKLTAATTGAAVGTLCGPLVWVCSPVAAVTFWFVTDVIIVTTLESINRDDFKKEIVQSIEYTKQELKNEYTAAYSASFASFSKRTVEKYGATPVKTIERIKGK